MWRRLAAVVSLFLLSPLIAEYLLGSLPMSMIAILPLMALMYGSGAILIREWARRTGRGWPTIVLLATAYGLIEEGFVTQSLFNPNYLHLRLIDFGFIPLLGTALPWLVFVTSIHVIWSISVPIALTESLFKGQRETPWLGWIGLTLFTVLFLAGCTIIATFSYKQAPFLATPAQFGVIGAVVLGLIVAAFLIPHARSNGRTAPHPLILFAAGFGAGSLLMLLEHFAEGQLHWPWPACLAALLATESLFIVFMTLFTRGRTWSDIQRFSLMAGGLLVYAWAGFLTDKELHGVADLPAHSLITAVFVLICGGAGLIALRQKH